MPAFTQTIHASANGISLIEAANYAAMRGLISLDADDDVAFGTLSLGLLGLYGDTNDNWLVNSADNSIEDGLARCVIAGGGAATWPNRIGTTGLPAGTGATPTEWAADTDYIAFSANTSFIGGGYDNVCNQLAGIVVGGGHNFLKYDAIAHSVIVGGSYNVIAAGRSVIVGGQQNTITGAGSGNFVGGGVNNNITGSYSVIPGGLNNVVAGSYSLAFGRAAQANADGCVVLCDSDAGIYAIATANTFGAKFSGGYYLTGGNVSIPDGNIGVNASASSSTAATIRSKSYSAAILELQNKDNYQVFSITNDGDGDGILYLRNKVGDIKAYISSVGNSYLRGGGLEVSKTIHFGAANINTPSGADPTLTIDLGAGNHHKINLTSASGTLALTLDAPPGFAGGMIFVKQHAATSVDMTFTGASPHTVQWQGTEPDWGADTPGKRRTISWGYDPDDDIIQLTATDTN